MNERTKKYFYEYDLNDRYGDIIKLFCACSLSWRWYQPTF